MADQQLQLIIKQRHNKIMNKVKKNQFKRKKKKLKMMEKKKNWKWELVKVMKMMKEILKEMI